MTRRTIVLLSILAAVAALILFPMRLALALSDAETAGLRASEVSGTIWSATARDLHLGSARVGNVSMGLDPWSLLAARLRLDIDRPDNAQHGALSARWQRDLFGQTAIAFDGTVDGPTDTMVPIETIRFDGFSAVMADDGCSSANGNVRLTLRARIAGLDLRNGLSGAATCRSGTLVVPLVGQSGMERVTVSIRPDGRYQAQLLVRADDPLLAAALAGAGLQPVAGGFGLSWQGHY